MTRRGNLHGAEPFRINRNRAFEDSSTFSTRIGMVFTESILATWSAGPVRRTTPGNTWTARTSLVPESSSSLRSG